MITGKDEHGSVKLDQGLVLPQSELRSAEVHEASCVRIAAG